MAGSTGSGNESDSLAYTRRPQVPSLEPLALPFYCSPVPVLKNRLNSRSEVMILSRARDALQTPADTRFQWKGQGTEEHAQISLCLPEASRSGENQGHARDT